MKNQLLRLKVRFAAELDACPSCGEPRLNKQSAVCHACDYHAGAELTEQWTDYVQSLRPPAGEIIESYDDEYDSWIDLEFQFNLGDELLASDMSRLSDWMVEHSMTLDEDHSDGLLFERGGSWYCLPFPLACTLPHKWEPIDETDCRALLDGYAVYEVDGGWSYLTVENGCFCVSKIFETHDDADIACAEAIAELDDDDILTRLSLTDDAEACRWAIEQAQMRRKVYYAIDEDGYYFAVRIT